MAIDFSKSDLVRFSPRMQPNYWGALLAGKDTLRKHGILDNGQRLAHFMGQFAAETEGGIVGRESLTYTTVAAVRGAWKARASKHTDAWIKANLLRNPRALGDWAYGGRMGNTKGTSDGYDFRGGGFLQTTGRDNVEKFCSMCELEVDPGILDDYRATLKFACAEWQASGCNELADANDLMGISKAINTGSATSGVYPNGMANRERWFAKAQAIWWNAEPDISAADAPPEVAHAEVHAELGQTSWGYALVGRGLQAVRWLAPTGAVGVAGKKAMEGGDATAVNVAPQAVDLLGQVGAASNLIAKFGLPFLAIALLLVLGLEAIRYWQRTHHMEAGHG